MYALAKANQLEQEATIEREVIGAQYFECPDIECGAVFSYCRVSCGRFVQPDFCPICGGPMKAAEEFLRTICQTGSAPEASVIRLNPAIRDRVKSGHRERQKT